MAKRNLNYCLSFSFLLVVLLNIQFVDSLGVALDYWPQNGDTEANPLKIYPGDSQVISIRLQNTDPEEVQARVILKDGGGIALMQESIYTVPGSTLNAEVPIEVKIPDEAEIGQKYMIVISVDSLVDSKGEGVSFGVGYDVKIPVEVVERPIQNSPLLTTTSIILYVASAILIILVIVLFVLRKKKK